MLYFCPVLILLLIVLVLYTSILCLSYTQTSMAHLPQHYLEVHRSQSDFQWLYDALQEASPERIVPPLKPPVSLDATMSEFQRFLARLAVHKVLHKHHLFIVFLTGTQEVRREIMWPALTDLIGCL